MSQPSSRHDLRQGRISSTDRRIVRTRARLVEAFRALIDESPGERVTVSAVVRRARVARSSFYTHFVDLGDLAATALTEVNDAIVSLARMAVQQGGSRTQTNRQVGLDIARYLADRKETFGPLLISGGRFAEALIASLAEQSMQTLRTRERLLTNPEVSAHYMAGGLVHVLAWWLNQGQDLTVDELADALISVTPADFVD
ncbi:MAG: hypothetical protein ACK5H2_12230 [Beutenbergiaceae bacterium]